MAEAIQIRGLEELTKKLDNVSQLKGVGAALKAAALHVKGKVAQYPPATEANRPGGPGSRWYERGYGTRWMREDGSVAGRKTSETLGRKWTIQSRNQGLTQIVGNNVSYGIYVQDEDYQASFHDQRGWKTIQEVAEQEADEVNDFVRAQIERLLNE